MNEIYLKTTIQKAGLDVDGVLAKTQEILRKLKIKAPIGCLHRAELGRHVIAIEIACVVLSLPFDKVKLTAQAPITFKIYQESLIHCKNLLNLQLDSDTMFKLACQYGATYKLPAYKILEQYKLLYIDKLDKNRFAVDVNSAVCQAAAFYIAITSNCAKKKQTVWQYLYICVVSLY